MNIYKVTRTDKWSYDDYDSLVVIAETPEIARRIHPNGKLLPLEGDDWGGSWALSPMDIEVRLIGTALEDSEQGVVLNSFNAG